MKYVSYKVIKWMNVRVLSNLTCCVDVSDYYNKIQIFYIIVKHLKGSGSIRRKEHSFSRMGKSSASHGRMPDTLRGTTPMIRIRG